MNKNTNSKNKTGIFLRLSRYVLEQWPLFIVALLLMFANPFIGKL